MFLSWLYVRKFVFIRSLAFHGSSDFRVATPPSGPFAQTMRPARGCEVVVGPFFTSLYPAWWRVGAHKNTPPPRCPWGNKRNHTNAEFSIGWTRSRRCDKLMSWPNTSVLWLTPHSSCECGKIESLHVVSEFGCIC
jgi:hypothetical protein